MLRLCLFIITLLCLCGGLDAGAQVTGGPSSMPDQWQLTLDGIKSKAQTLMVENNGLQVESDQLTEQAQELQQTIDDQQDKNEQLNRFLKDRHGLTAQELRSEELTKTIRAKKEEVRNVDEQLITMKRKQSDLDRNIQRSRSMVSSIELHRQVQEQKVQHFQSIVPPQTDDQLNQLRKQVEDESKQEVLLENELKDLKAGVNTPHGNVADIDAQNKELEDRLDILRLRKLQHLKKSSDTQLGQYNGRIYDQLQKRKDLLESQINSYELRMDELKQSSLAGLSWPLKKKGLVHALVQTDARNNKMRDNIKVLREDIEVLRDQVARLERRVDFAHGQGKDPKQ